MVDLIDIESNRRGHLRDEFVAIAYGPRFFHGAYCSIFSAITAENDACVQ